MISKLTAHDRQLGGKDGYERREEEEAFTLLIVDQQPSQSTLIVAT